MGLTGAAGRRRPKARLARLAIYIVLAAGAVTTVYPFLSMLSTAFKGPTDQNDGLLVPAYWRTEGDLYTKYVDDKYAGDVNQIAATRTGPADAATVALYRRFLDQLPLDCFTAGFRQNPNGVTGKLNVRYQSWLRDRYHTLTAINDAYIEENTSFETIQPPAEAFSRFHWSPTPSREWNEWLVFKAQLPPSYRVPVTLRGLFQSFARAKYKFSFANVPASIKGSAHDFDQLDIPTGGAVLAEFEATAVPPRYRSATVETRYLTFLGRQWKGDPVAASSRVRLPIEALERADVHSNAADLRREFSSRNFAYVLRYLTVNGSAFWNTLIFCGLATVATLAINALAAYALSRYPLRVSAKILVFLLATMAFPTEVTMIPNFLLLKGLHLLNTFAALVLPTAASGYIIFILKGFFDSLPQDLYEAASLDGAKEMTMLRRIALPLSRPVFGYFALITSVSAYGTFLYAFLVAQDRRIWTVMVFLYELSGTAPKYVMMAAFTLAALPTFLIFLFAQGVIQRGIVLPSER